MVLPLSRPAFWRAYLTTMRPYLMSVSGMAALAGLSLAGGTSPFRLALAMAALLPAYGLGQALTDCFQRDTDSLSAPYRPLVQGRLSPRQVLAVSLGGLAAGLAILAALNPRTLPLSAAAILGLVLYSPLKRRWWAGPPVNSAVVGLLPILGWLAADSAGLQALPENPAVLAAAAASFLAYANFVLVGYLKDVSADRETGYVTLPVRFGWRATARVSHLHAVAALVAAAAALLAAERAPGFAGLLVLAAAALLTVRTQIDVHRARREEEAHRPIAGTVRVFLLLMTAIVAAGDPRGWAIAGGIWLLFEVLLRRRPERTQI